MAEIKLDDETTAALTLFNEYVIADRERTQREKRIRKAERAKDEAAAVVKKLSDSDSAEEKAEAEKEYRDAADAWKRLRDGKESKKPAADEKSTDAPADAPQTEDDTVPDTPADAPQTEDD